MTSAFVPFHQHYHQHPSNDSVSPPTPPLPSPPLYSSHSPTAAATKLPSLFEPRTTTRDRRDDNAIFDTTPPPSLALRPMVMPTKTTTMLHHPTASPPFGFSLPPLQNVISSATMGAPEHALCSPPEETEELVSASSPSVSSSSDGSGSRKGSIASLLNSDPELRLGNDQHHQCHQPSAFPPLSLKRGSCQDEAATRPKKRKCNDAPTRRTTSTLRGGSDDDSSRANKGLRHFSKQVCDKVAEKGVTTYNEVADELALDIRANMDNEKRSFDQKNIRRRVYDALNVFMAMDIIAKDKKQIKWLGIPSYFGGNHNHQQNQTSPSDVEMERYLELQKLVDQEERRQAHLLSSMDHTRGLIQDKLAQHLQLCNLVWRNQHSQHHQFLSSQDKISLPFFIIASQDDAHIQVANDGLSAEISQASSDAMDEQMVFEDADVLRCLGLNRLSREQLAAWLPDPSWQSLLSSRPSMCDDSIYIRSSADMVSATSS
ncbi:hypothetical protein O0I10_006050 [Lichtheimia ornata]|uniref:E2F/DP family winged-helix DNA-binding domain-containing protein n=1 Tax=Lichtheimia ornata TaxID=688661 RepID=A0AAD7V510_9FUNG|nr:uncharacterized protein O0I10_006050 [Lichtheimia ornata]KAJ8658365.1 hypothetical protein O0I10_006050 [Lichtheimia ornata]